MRIDYTYFLYFGPALLFALWAQWKLSRAHQEAGSLAASCRLSGEEIAGELLSLAGVRGVRIMPEEGYLSNHYMVGVGVLRLSPENYLDDSVLAVATAAHETGHALQEANNFPLLAFREFVVPWSGILGNATWIVLFVGLVLWVPALVLVALSCFSLGVLLQVLNLPVELNASRRGYKALREAGLIGEGEEKAMSRALNAQAWTAVAATLFSILTMRHLFSRSRAYARGRHK